MRAEARKTIAPRTSCRGNRQRQRERGIDRAAAAQQPRDHRRSRRLADAPQHGDEPGRARDVAGSQPTHFLEREVGDRGERQAEQEAAEGKAGRGRRADADRDRDRLQDVGRGEDETQIAADAHARRQQRADDDAGAEDRPVQVEPGRPRRQRARAITGRNVAVTM